LHQAPRFQIRGAFLLVSPTRKRTMADTNVLIFDTTLRDGEQAPGNSLTPEEKLRLARQLDALAVDIIEAGFPAASEGDYRSVREIAAEIRRPVLAALARCHDRDIELAGEALSGAARPRLHVFVSTSDLHIKDKLRTDRDGVLTMTRAAIRRARQYTDDVEFSAEDASRTDPDFLCRVVEAAIEEGATTVNLPDTVGYAMPAEYAAMFRDVRERVPGSDRVVWSAHCHNDLGLAVANTLAAISAGATQVECTVNGIGERAGNAALEEIVMASRVRGPALNFSCNVESREIYRTSQLLSYLTGVFPQPNKAVVGRNAFAHEAGIHQHGMLQNGLTYEIIRPEMVGIPRSTLVLGKHSGRHALERRYQELGYQLNEHELAEVYQGFTALAERKGEILDEDLLALLHESFHDAPEEFQLSHLRVVCGSVTATAEVRMTGPWAGERSARGTGDGPIAAAFAAVSDILGRHLEVLSLTLRSVTPGRDSVGQVFLQAKIDGKSLSGHSASTDIVEASARALVHALNKARYAERLEDSSLNSVYLWGV
jgi:2-isopropylmalate synthase